MADLTLTQRFGQNVSFNPTSKILSVNLNDLASVVIAGSDVGLDVSGMTAENQDQYASRILWSLLQLSQQNQPENNNDETVGVYVTNQGKRSISRNNVAQFGFQLVATAYQNDNIGVTLDPDNING